MPQIAHVAGTPRKPMCRVRAEQPCPANESMTVIQRGLRSGLRVVRACFSDLEAEKT